MPSFDRAFVLFIHQTRKRDVLEFLTERAAKLFLPFFPHSFCSRSSSFVNRLQIKHQCHDLERRKHGQLHDRRGCVLLYHQSTVPFLLLEKIAQRSRFHRKLETKFRIANRTSIRLVNTNLRRTKTHLFLCTESLSLVCCFSFRYHHRTRKILVHFHSLDDHIRRRNAKEGEVAFDAL